MEHKSWSERTWLESQIPTLENFLKELPEDYIIDRINFQVRLSKIREELAKLDKDGYPEDDELEKITKWDSIEDSLGLIRFVQNLWAYSDYFYFDYVSKNLELHTGGWSGNEEIIGALQANIIFWTMFWLRSERGGHYYFIVKLPWDKEKTNG